ncbi:Maf family nucleotide pyrophosphatase [Porticoccus sp. W117]|uniref:Maf family protein n=1 Tax=Porticoccus sp. W117 TaxID=3054777 RepID=UPI00259A6DBF|nr:Maf family nucleotide pyrophosphatase [Porticoccus sp. W117]MDM3872144.1 Maf family nucleotide pyrophosphatase [Porticoccus sp. W117]
MTEIALASSSPYRRQLLERLGLPFQCQSPQVDETPLAGESPTALAVRLSQSKARALAEPFPDHHIIGSDQVAECNGTILHKPGDFDAARQQLQQQSGNTVSFHTGLCLYNSASGESQTDVVTTTVHFRVLSNEEIERYLHREQPYDCAGSFKVEQLGVSLFEKVESSDPTALVGLPLIRLCEMLRQSGVRVL